MDVLIAHGGEASRRGLVKALRPLDVSLMEVDDGADALEALLGDGVPGIALIDWDLPRIEGPELCRLVRDFHIVHPPYVILLAGTPHGNEVPLGLKAGAHDCVRTPVTPDELRARVEMARRFVELPWGRAGSGCADALTGVLAREDAVQRLDHELVRARREHQELSIGILDVDGLARVNETAGRAAGDAVLREVVRRLRAGLRAYDVIGRVDGEEFLLILSNTCEPDVVEVLGRLRREVAAEPFEHGGHLFDLTVTLGGATGGEQSAGELIATARRALDEAQAAGPDRVVVGLAPLLEAVLVPE